MNDTALSAKPKKKHRGGWLKNPKIERDGETIGGGWWVFRRGDGTSRIRPSHWPFEYASEEAAAVEAKRLAAANPGETFIVVGQSQAVLYPVQEEAA